MRFIANIFRQFRVRPDLDYRKEGPVRTGQFDEIVMPGPNIVQRLTLSSNPRVGEIKLDIVDRSIVRKLDDSGFINHTSNATPRSIPGRL